MKLSPLEIRRHDFGLRIRGFDREEVRLFLDQVSTDWEAVLEEQRRSKARIDELEAKLNHYQKVEEALQEALRTARENAVKTQDNAKAQAEIIIEEARLKAKQIVHEAEEAKDDIAQRAKKLLKDAESERDELVEESRGRMRRIEQERTGVVLEIARLSDRRDHILSRLRAFLLSEMELLAKFEEADTIGYIKFLPAGTESASATPPLPGAEQARDGQADPEAQPGSEAEQPGSEAEQDTSAAETPEAKAQEPASPETGAADAPGGEQDEPVDPDQNGAGYTVKQVVRPVPGQPAPVEKDAPDGERAEEGGSEASRAGDDAESAEEMQKIRRML